MSYRVNDIFYSLQGEGINTGRAAVFIRFSGCNMACPFCDTDHIHYREMTAEEIVGQIAPYPTRLVILTGGEPALQVDEALIKAMHDQGYTIAIETNGTRPLPEGIDWITLSPKAGGRPVLTRCDELKVLFLRPDYTPDTMGITADHYLLQPCDTGDKTQNEAIVQAALQYIMSHPEWRLSLQTHKLANYK